MVLVSTIELHNEQVTLGTAGSRTKDGDKNKASLTGIRTLT